MIHDQNVQVARIAVPGHAGPQTLTQEASNQADRRGLAKDKDTQP
jgi:hypothetical protein